MNFDFSEDQWTIKRTARELLRERVSFARVRDLAAQGRDDDRLWAELCDLGWTGIFVPEDLGGQGLGMVELVAILEECGRVLAPTPLLASASAALVLLAAGDAEQQRLIPEIASGRLSATTGRSRDGRAPAVLNGADSAIVLLVDDDEHATLVASPEGVATPVDSLDLTRRIASVDAASGSALPHDAGGGLDRILVAIAAETLGSAEQAMDLAVAYAKEREQFGRPIGTYQAVQHLCARMMMRLECARSLTYHAAWVADAEPERLRAAAAMAAAYTSDAGWRICASALQVFGGIGFTWEHDMHLLLRRTKASASLFSTARQQREAVARAVLDEPVGV